MFVFGPGVLIGTLAGSATPTPVNIGLIQEATYAEKSTNKALFGQNRRALAVGGGTIKSSLKAKMARFSGLALSQLYLGISPTAGGTFPVIAEAHTLPSSTPSVTIAPPNSGTFATDLGVIYAATGVPLTRASGAPATGSYSLNVSTGVYTFAAGDDSKAVQISYEYSVGASYGQSVAATDPLLGATVSFAADIAVTDPTTNLMAVLHIYNCVPNNFSFGTKLEDFVMPEMDFDCFANAAGQSWAWNIPDTQ